MSKGIKTIGWMYRCILILQIITSDSYVSMSYIDIRMYKPERTWGRGETKKNLSEHF